MALYEIDDCEHATILAALRFYQQEGLGDPFSRSDEIHEIATNNDQVISLNEEAIDTLCEELNTGARTPKSVDLPAKVHVLVIDHKHGTDLWAFRTQEGVDRQRVKWAREWWMYEFNDSITQEELDAMPDDKVSEKYWERQSDHGEEWATWEEVTLED